MNKEKVAEKGGGKNGWEGVAEVEFRGVETDRTADEILARREENFGKNEASSAEFADGDAEFAEGDAEFAEGDAESAEGDAEREFGTLERRGMVEPVQREKTATEKLEEYIAEPEWREPEIKEFFVGQERGIDTEKMIVYPISAEKRAAVPREKAVWSFMNQVHKAETAADFSAANALAQALRNEGVDAEVNEQISDFMKSPAYQMKAAGFRVENVRRALAADRETLELSRQRYDEVRKGGFFRRFLNRWSINEGKARVASTEKRVREKEAELRRAERELTRFMPNVA